MKRTLVLALFAAVHALGADDVYTAVSLKQALAHANSSDLKSNSAYNLAWVTTPVAVLLDSSAGDVLLIGRRQANAYHLTLDEIKLSLLNSASRDLKTSAGISIEPPRVAGEYDRASRFFNVRYIGEGIERSRTGAKLFEADISFKLLGLGFEPLGIDGLPTEWDLSVHALRKPYAVERYVAAPGLYFYYPEKAAIRKDPEGVSLQALRLSVGTHMLGDNYDSPADPSPRRVTAVSRRDARRLDGSAADKYLADYGSSLEAFADVLNQNMDELMKREPAIAYFRSFVGLIALWRGVGSDLPPDLRARIDAYVVAPCFTPSRVDALQRRIDGLSHSLASGGVTASFYDFAEAKAEKPTGLLRVAQDFRPSPNAVSWPLPVDVERALYSTKAEWMRVLAAQEDSEIHAYREGISSLGPQVSVSVDEAGHWTDAPQPKVTPGWRPSTAGHHLFEATGNLELGTTSGAGYSNQFLYAFQEAPQELFGLNYNLKFRYAFNDRFEVGIEENVVCKLMSFPDVMPASKWSPTPTSLPGLVNYGFAAGFANPEIYATALITPDAGHWPQMIAQVRYVTPFFYEALNDSGLNTVFALDGYRLSGVYEITHRFTPRLKLGCSVQVGTADYTDAFFNKGRRNFQTFAAISETEFTFRGSRMILGTTPSVSRIGSDRTYGLDLSARMNAASSMKVSLGLYHYPHSWYYYYSLSIPWERVSFRYRRWF